MVTTEVILAYWAGSIENIAADKQHVQLKLVLLEKVKVAKSQVQYVMGSRAEIINENKNEMTPMITNIKQVKYKMYLHL